MAVGGLAVRHEAASAAAVRRTIAAALSAQSVSPDSIDDVVLVASELIGNAVRHADASFDESLDVTWQIGESSVVVGVTDGSAELPRHRCSGDTETGGRGLAIIAAIARDWGAERRGRGKHVWARIRVRRAPAFR